MLNNVSVFSFLKKFRFEKDISYKMLVLPCPMRENHARDFWQKLIFRLHLSIVGVEDLDGYHGKALGDKGKKAVEEIKALIADETFPLRPPSVIDDDAPKVDLTVKLSEPPNYKKEDKVGNYC